MRLEYKNRFTCIPAGLPYRPALLTSKPTVLGTQTATVVGPPGEKIFCDKYGRVKVQFHWDRQGKKDANSSCWVRVAQPWAGGGFGAIAIPRIGDEVVVDFLEGDPDQPLIVGCVYNFDKMPPFSLPEHRMFSGIKSNSVEGRPAENFSGLSLNDTPDGERVGLYAEKDMRVNAEHNQQHHVGNFQHVKIGRMHLSSVGGLPGVGGSGGGGGPESDYEGKTVGPQPVYEKPGGQFGDWSISNQKLAAAMGLAGTVVYGINAQDTLGFMHQVTIGAAYQFCINPLAPFYGWFPGVGEAAGGPLLSVLGSLGGNVQICWGTNTQAVYGASVSITHGNQINITGKPNGGIVAMATVVPLLCLGYQIAYAAIGQTSNLGSDHAAELAATFGGAAIASNAVLLGLEGAFRTEKMATLGANFTKEALKGAASLVVAGSQLQPDWAEQMTAYMKDHTKVTAPEMPLTPMDFGNSLNMVEGTMLHSAKSIFVIAAKDPLALTDSTPSFVYINAAGKGDDGVGFFTATKSLTLASGGASLALEKKDDTSGDLALNCGARGSITLLNMPKKAAATALMDFTKTSIQLRSGIPPAAQSITLDATGTSIELQSGPPGSGASITLDAKMGIKMQAGPNVSLELDPRFGIKMKVGPDMSLELNPFPVIGGITLKNKQESLQLDSLLGIMIDCTLFTKNVKGLLIIN